MILEADNIDLSFNHHKILYGVYLKAEKGKITGILGRNGCGKTSLLRIIFGDLTPKYGNIRINGIHQKKVLYKKNITSYLPQHQLLPNNINLINAFNLYNVNWNAFTDIFDSFKKYKNYKILELSSGERRVVETYLTLESKKDIILLDEPFSFISPIYVEKIKELIHRCKLKSAIIITDHFYKDIIDISDSMYLIKGGVSKLMNNLEDLKNEGYI